MMDFLVRWMTPRNGILFIGISFMCWAYAGRVPRLARYYYHRLVPDVPQKGLPPPDLKEQLTKQDLAALTNRYRRLWKRLDQAEAEGFNVEGLRAQAKAAFQVGRMGFRWKAQEIMNAVEMSVPRKKVQYIPLYPTLGDEPPEAQTPNVAPAAAEAKAAKPAKASASKRPASKAAKKKKRRTR